MNLNSKVIKHIEDVLHKGDSVDCNEIGMRLKNRGFKVRMNEVNDILYEMHERGILEKSTDYIPKWSIPTLESRNPFSKPRQPDRSRQEENEWIPRGKRTKSADPSWMKNEGDEHENDHHENPTFWKKYVTASDISETKSKKNRISSKLASMIMNGDDAGDFSDEEQVPELEDHSQYFEKEQPKKKFKQITPERKNDESYIILINLDQQKGEDEFLREFSNGTIYGFYSDHLKKGSYYNKNYPEMILCMTKDKFRNAVDYLIAFSASGISNDHHDPNCHFIIVGPNIELANVSYYLTNIGKRKSKCFQNLEDCASFIESNK